MKASTFAIVIGAMLVALAPVGIVAPGGYLEALKDFAARLPLVHAGAVTWVVMSLLVVIRPAHGRSLNERFVRVLAWLVLVKSLAMLWIPGFLPTAMGWLESLPGWAMSLGSLCDFAFGLFMLWTARRLIRAESDPHAREHLALLIFLGVTPLVDSSLVGIG